MIDPSYQDNDYELLNEIVDRYSNQNINPMTSISDKGKIIRITLNDTGLKEIPDEIFLIKSLQELDLRGNYISYIPEKIARLTALKKLMISDNRVNSVPDEIGELKKLSVLSLGHNQINSFPNAISRLSRLRILDLSNNGIEYIPGNIGNLKSLEALYLSNNQLATLPAEVALLNNLNILDVSYNPLVSPPPEISNRGIRSIVEYLNELAKGDQPRYEAKLIFVGEGGTGKSSLLAALRGEKFIDGRATTHGVEVGKLELSSPTKSSVNLSFNTWDFGGQDIYHATHQFFLTHRSFYLVLWNARLGHEQGRLTYWLETIRALAPNAPVLLVATHIDEREPDINYYALKRDYPNLIGMCAVSSKFSVGIDELIKTIYEHASDPKLMPLMGQPWPKNWLESEYLLNALDSHYISADRYVELCVRAGTSHDIANGELASYLHDLGKILYFNNDSLLSNLVVLKPNWITKAVSKVLTNENVRSARGVLDHSELKSIWSVDESGKPYGQHLHPILLRLMERFELSFQMEPEREGEPVSRSLVPQLLPHEPPADIPTFSEQSSSNIPRIELIYRLSFVPAGVMSRFIVRTHRYSEGLHWRDGVVLRHELHVAYVELNAQKKEVRVVVQGPFPQTFLVILRDTLDRVLSRFEGLSMQHEVPCICERCQNPGIEVTGQLYSPRYYRYQDLEKRITSGKLTIDCPESLEEVSISTLLYGIHPSTNGVIMREILTASARIQNKLEYIEASVVERYKYQTELIARNYTLQWNRDVNRIETTVPLFFALMPDFPRLFNPRTWVANTYRMHLLCQHNQAPHMVSSYYNVQQNKQWWAIMAPWLSKLVEFMKVAVPLSAAGMALYSPEMKKQLEASLKLMEEIVKTVSVNSTKDVQNLSGNRYDQRYIETPELRAYYQFLLTADPYHSFGGLSKVETPDGNVLWLCEEHRESYEPKQLVNSSQPNPA